MELMEESVSDEVSKPHKVEILAEALKFQKLGS
jgi:hypothetical protein